MKAISIPGMLVLIGLQGLVLSTEEDKPHKYASAAVSAAVLCVGWILNLIAIFQGGL